MEGEVSRIVDETKYMKHRSQRLFPSNIAAAFLFSNLPSQTKNDRNESYM